jgi:hypothetical protein
MLGPRIEVPILGFGLLTAIPDKGCEASTQTPICIVCYLGNGDMRCEENIGAVSTTKRSDTLRLPVLKNLAPQFSASNIRVSLARRAVSAVQLPELNRQTPEVEHTVTYRKQKTTLSSNRQKIQKCLSRFWRTRSDCASSIGPRAVLTARNSRAKEKRNPASSNSAIIVAR